MSVCPHPDPFCRKREKDSFEDGGVLGTGQCGSPTVTPSYSCTRPHLCHPTEHFASYSGPPNLEAYLPRSAEDA